MTDDRGKAAAMTAHDGVLAGGSRLAAAVAAALLGVFILYGVGFAQPNLLHNAAHDSRHGFAFPCH